MPHTLLLADDSVTIQRVIELTFADEDVTVIAVSDGDQAIEHLESAPPDIVLADIGMPGKNGYEVARYIKQSPKLSHIPVVLLTGAFEPVDQARASEAGCDGVLAKPFEPQLVIGRVKDLLAKSRRVPASIDETLAAPLAPAADRWSPPVVDQAFAPASAAAQPAPPLDDYFDRLDAAFQNLSGSPSGQAPKPAGPPVEPVPDIDWFATKTESSAPATEPWDLPAPAARPDAPDLPLSYSSSQAAVDAASQAPPPIAPHSDPETPLVTAAASPQSVGVSDVTPDVVPSPVASPPPALSPAPPLEPPKIAALPPLADAFAALLAAEQGEPLSTTVPTWPATSASTDELVEQITRRVLDRLSDQVVRDTVSDIVSQIAERLVREEIERIKATIK